MEDKKLREVLEQLRREIDNNENLDETGKRLTGNIKNEIDTFLQTRAEGGSTSHISITKRLEEAVSHLEESHPEFAFTLSEFLSILSNAGI